MKQIDGKAQRVLNYQRWFYWYAGLGGFAAIVLAAYVLEWNLPGVLISAFGGVCIGYVACLLLRDTP